RAVAAERSTRGGGHCEKVHHRHGAVMPGADRNALVIENRADVMRMYTAHRERDDRRLVSRRADELNATNGRQLGRGELKQALLMRGNGIKSQRLDVVDGGAEADGARDIGSPGLESPRQIVVGALLKGDAADHVA